ASAARARKARHGSIEAGRVLAVAFPDSQMQVLPYNRVVRDLNGRSAEQLLESIARTFSVRSGGPESAARKGTVAMYLHRQWHAIDLKTPADGLDVDVLQTAVLEPLFGIRDVRTDKRIDFVGGIRGTKELERLVDSGDFAVAFSLHPVSVRDLMRIADQGGIMPPKSTWFEPKLRDGLLSHLI
ncbi:MAG TPA: DUF1015 family protein, partial [Vicinamibacterales bacterium]|nr:DUF1015 family protein [Vicinamibacterales bacterium]